jgi:hypothetical protein
MLFCVLLQQVLSVLYVVMQSRNWCFSAFVGSGHAGLPNNHVLTK